MTGNFISEGLAEYSQQSFAFDVGTLYDVGALGMRIGMAISNIGSQIKFIDRSARMPSIASRHCGGEKQGQDRARLGTVRIRGQKLRDSRFAAE